MNLAQQIIFGDKNELADAMKDGALIYIGATGALNAATVTLLNGNTEGMLLKSYTVPSGKKAYVLKMSVEKYDVNTDKRVWGYLRVDGTSRFSVIVPLNQYYREVQFPYFEYVIPAAGQILPYGVAQAAEDLSLRIMVTLLVVDA